MSKDQIKQLSISKKLSEDTGPFTSVFHYRLEKELGVGITESGEACEAYCKVTLEHANPIDYDHFHKQVVLNTQVAQGDPEMVPHISPITLEEYVAAVTEDDPQDQEGAR